MGPSQGPNPGEDQFRVQPDECSLRLVSIHLLPAKADLSTPHDPTAQVLMAEAPMAQAATVAEAMVEAATAEAMGQAAMAEEVTAATAALAALTAEARIAGEPMAAARRHLEVVRAGAAVPTEAGVTPGDIAKQQSTSLHAARNRAAFFCFVWRQTESNNWEATTNFNGGRM